jgi:putative sterol carrier protein
MLVTADPSIEVLMALRDGFLPGRASGVRATVEWRVKTKAGIDRLWMRIDDGSCLVSRQELEPSVTVEVATTDLAELVDGQFDATELFLEQRLTVSGDFLLAVRLPGFFGLTARPALSR